MREDIAQLYREMKSSPSPVIYSDPDAAEGESSETVEADEDDFELSTPIVGSGDIADNELGDDTDFELQTGAPHAPTPAADTGGETYSLGASPVEENTTPASTADTPPQPAASSEASAEQPPAEDASSPSAPPNSEETTAESARPDSSTGDEQPEKKAAPAPGDIPEGGAHSIATAGDALLQIAIEEEQEAGQRKGRRSATGSFRISCPYGHRVEVHERHRGKVGRCPRCRSRFIVPEEPLEVLMALARTARAENAAEEAAETGEEQSPGGRFTSWMTDVRVHTVDPTKLKLKPGSLETAFQPMDLGFADDGFLLVSLAKKKSGLFGGTQSADDEREAMLAHLAAGNDLQSLTAEHSFFGAEAADQVAVVQPAPYAHESMFAGVPVFGEGRIAVRLPDSGSSGELRFLTFGLQAFRQLQQQFARRYDVQNLGAEAGVPLEDTFSKYECHYSENALVAVDSPEFYLADEQSQTELLGWRCGACGLAVSEDARKKEKIGGKNARGLAKAKCPKCAGVFGSNPLYELKNQAPEENAEDNADS